jgi:predicted SAM-dependent methyltransferase
MITDLTKRVRSKVRAHYRDKRTHAIIDQLIRSEKPIWIEVGAGNKQGANGWLTIDYNARDCDIHWDLRRGLPFPGGTVEKIYSSHFLEHLTFKEGQTFLAECWRVMSSGGLFSIAVPNARIYLESYVRKQPLPTEFFVWPPAYNNTTAIDIVNYTAHMDGQHRYCFDEENLLCRLVSAGFQNAHLRPFDPALDLPQRDFESIYAEAIKQP